MRSSPYDSNASVGFFGLGNMGLPMVTNLAKSPDLSVVAYDTNPDIVEQAQAVGIEMSSSVEDLLSHTPSTLITMLPGDSAVDSVMEVVMAAKPWSGSNGNRKSQLIIDCSTVSPATSRRWHDQLASLDAGGDQNNNSLLFVDAPVSGGVKGAQDATLTFMVGASQKVVESRIVPILSKMGQRIVACGGPGSGAAVKLCNNLALAAQMVGVAEAMNLGEALGVNPTVLADVMNTSTAKSWSCEVNNPHPEVASQTGSSASKDYQGGFGTRLMLKDLGLAVQAGKDVNVALPIGTATKELYQLANLRGLGDKDFGVILQFLQGR